MAELAACVPLAVKELVALHKTEVVALVLLVDAAFFFTFMVLAGFKFVAGFGASEVSHSVNFG